MAVHLFAIVFILAGQAGSANDRYSAPANPPDNRSTPADFQPLSGSETKSQAGSSSRQPRGEDPYSPPNTPAGQQSYPSGNSFLQQRSGVAPPPPRNGSQSGAANSPSNPPAAGSSSGPKPSSMMRDMLAPPPGSQLTGEPVQLIEVVAGGHSRLEQTQRVDAYWDLCSSAADYYLAVREQEEFRQLRSSASGASNAWQEIEPEMQTRIDTSLRAARASQLRVAGWLGRGADRLPLPADMPHCGSYHSRYAEVFAGRPSPEAQELAELLPLRYAELKDAATAVKRAEEFVGRVAREDTTGGTGTLRALEFAALRRRAFVQIARDYNRRIARYAELATPGEIGAERLIGMLIKVDNSSTATRPATGRQSSDMTAMPPRTFASGEGWEPARSRAGNASRDDAVQPASGTAPQGPVRERSLLVSPR